MVTMNPLRHVIEGRWSYGSSTAGAPYDPAGADSEDDVALAAAEIEQLDAELLLMGERLERIKGELTAALQQMPGERVLAGV
jgi:hypothetical protein